MTLWQAVLVACLLAVLALVVSQALAYDRGDYPTWLDLDGDGLDTRAEVLIRDSLIRPTIDRWQVTAGLWVDPYTGAVIRDPSELDIDHVLALAEIDAAGGARLPDRIQARIANDLDNLVAVSASANRSKGARNVAEWIPPNLAHCIEYLDTRKRTRERWGLAVDPDEVHAIAFWRQHCPRHEIGIKIGRVRAWLGSWSDLLF